MTDTGSMDQGRGEGGEATMVRQGHIDLEGTASVQGHRWPADDLDAEQIETERRAGGGQAAGRMHPPSPRLGLKPQALTA